MTRVEAGVSLKMCCHCQLVCAPVLYWRSHLQSYQCLQKKCSGGGLNIVHTQTGLCKVVCWLLVPQQTYCSRWTTVILAPSGSDDEISRNQWLHPVHSCCSPWTLLHWKESSNWRDVQKRCKKIHFNLDFVTLIFDDVNTTDNCLVHLFILGK